jgi:hypothetical protein
LQYPTTNKLVPINSNNEEIYRLVRVSPSGSRTFRKSPYQENIKKEVARSAIDVKIKIRFTLGFLLFNRISCSKPTAEICAIEKIRKNANLLRLTRSNPGKSNRYSNGGIPSIRPIPARPRIIGKTEFK